MSLIRIDRNEIEKMDKIQRLHLINSCTGFKSANLIGTISNSGQSNVAIFSSVTHLGSDPALIGFIIRPSFTPRNTYVNLKEYGYFSVNHVYANIIAGAHQSSANYTSDESEFDQTHLEAVYHGGCPVPFVKGSPVKLLCKYLNEYLIEENGCMHIIASIEAIFYEEELIDEEMHLHLEKGKVVTIAGIKGYLQPILLKEFTRATIPPQADITSPLPQIP
jgi:flavin reductase (DIM6/NTAB) family NADH-FMN oxidoreductase RutF